MLNQKLASITPTQEEIKKDLSLAKQAIAKEINQMKEFYEVQKIKMACDKKKA